MALFHLKMHVLNVKTQIVLMPLILLISIQEIFQVAKMK